MLVIVSHYGENIPKSMKIESILYLIGTTRREGEGKSGEGKGRREGNMEEDAGRPARQELFKQEVILFLFSFFF